MPTMHSNHIHISFMLTLSVLLVFLWPTVNNISGSNVSKTSLMVDTTPKTNLFFPKKLKPTVSALVSEIASNRTVDCSAVGYSGKQSEQFKRYIKLSEIASDSQLIILTNHWSVIVKAYAFLALKERESFLKDKLALKKLIDKHITDKQSFQFYCGCTIETERINSWFLRGAESHLSKEEIENYRNRISN